MPPADDPAAEALPPSTAPPPPGTPWVDVTSARCLIYDHAQLVGAVQTMGRRLTERLALIEAEQRRTADAVGHLVQERLVEADAVLSVRRASTQSTLAADAEVSQAGDRVRAAEAGRAAEVAELRTAAVDTATALVRAGGDAARTPVARWIIIAIASGIAGLGAGQSDILGSLSRAAVAALSSPSSGDLHADPGPAPPP